MPGTNQREQDIFHGCLSLPAGRRSLYLRSACGANSELLHRIERLIEAHLQAEASEDDEFDCIAAEILAPATTPRLPALGHTNGPNAGDNIGSWCLVRKIGEGGMASVWLAERSDGDATPQVAIKLPLPGLPQRVLVERMAREREVLLTLNHPNIARLWQAGLTTDGQPYLALEYVEGQVIGDFCRQRGMTVVSRLELFLQVASAITYAHNNLVLHRDLKPSNILVTPSGGVRILDFGIAKLLEGGITQETELTRYSGPALTLDYASPEQLLGKPLTVASDVYSLAVVLYEMLTGARPYHQKRPSRAALEDAILTEEPRRPSDLVSDPLQRRKIRGDLDTILLKALKKDPEERYPTVEAFAEDLRRYLQNRPVLARPDSRAYRFAKFVRRHRIGIAAAATVGAILLLASIAIAWQVQSKLAQRERAEAAKAFLISILLDAHSYWGSGKPTSAVDLLRNAEARVSPRALPDTESRVEVLDIVGAGLLSQQEMKEGEAAIDRAVQDAGALPGRHPMALRARMLKEWIRLYRGRIANVRSEIDPLLRDMLLSPATLPEDIAGAYRIRSASALAAGDYAVAEADAQEALRVAKTRLNPHHNQSVLALVDLCYAQLARGDPVARQTGESALGRALEAYGGSRTHPNVLAARIARAQAIAADGELEPAIGEIGHAIEDASALFGPSARTVGTDLLYLARLQLRAGQFSAALASASRAKQILDACLDPSGAGYASLLEITGSALLKTGRSQEAGEDLNRAEQLFRNSFGPASPPVKRVRQLRLSLANHG